MLTKPSRSALLALCGSAMVLGVPRAEAFEASDFQIEARGWERLDGKSLRLQPALRSTVPSSAEAAWMRFVAAHPQSLWRAVWDHHTQVPLQILGRGVAAPGATADAARAETQARALLMSHLDLLAPGAKAEDFELVVNALDPATQLRIVSYAQRAGGFQVRDAHLSVRIRSERIFAVMSSAAPHVRPPSRSDGSVTAYTERVALDLLGREAPPDQLSVLSTSKPFILPLISAEGVSSHPLVREVLVATHAPADRWAIYVDILSGGPVARERRVRPLRAEVSLDVPDRAPHRGRVRVPAAELDLRVEGQEIRTDPQGRIAGPEGETAVRVEASPSGRRVRVANAQGPSAPESRTASDDASVIFGQSQDARLDAIWSAYAFADRASRYIGRVAPEDPFLTQPLFVEINLEGECNAFADREGIHFYLGSERCENTARLADVVTHEYGHAVHLHSLVPGVGRFEAALAEGLADYLAASLSNDPGMGRGFFKDDLPLRDLAPSNPARWPDDIGSDPHTTGLILGQALWDLRSALIDKLGFDAGALHADRLWYGALRWARDIPSVYAELLGIDDDDGDLSNGTPHGCAIHTAFARHGLAEPSGSRVIGSFRVESGTVHLPVRPAPSLCPTVGIRSATLVWRVRGPSGQEARLPLREGSGEWTVPLPEVDAGTVVELRFELELESGSVLVRPVNPASPWYEHYVGETDALFCTDFETNPWENGWTHELRAGEDRNGADDWQWDRPAGEPGSGDPARAFSGNYVVGNDLGQGLFNGRYQSGKTSALISPPVRIPLGYRSVRLQYRRWLTVEDGVSDRARILADGVPVWENRETSAAQALHHEDREWRFHDVDLSAAAADGEVVLAFELAADGGLDFGGWTLDDLCIVGERAPNEEASGDPSPPDPWCSDGRKPPCVGEESSPSPPTVDAVDPGCGCSTTAEANPTGLGLVVTGLMILLRRRRAMGAAELRSESPALR